MKKFRITVDGRTYDVIVETLEDEAPANPQPDPAWSQAPVSSAPPPAPPPTFSSPSTSATTAGAVVSPLAGRVVSIDCKVGQHVESGDTLATLEAMKMNAFVAAPSSGTVTSVLVAVGDAVTEDQVLFTLQ